MTTPSPFLGSTSGLSRQRLRARSYDRLSRDVYVLRDSQLDLRARTEGVILVLADAVPCLFTAALLQRLPVDDDGSSTSRAGRRPRDRGAWVSGCTARLSWPTSGWTSTGSR
jgi:hypothetical protein